MTARIADDRRARPSGQPQENEHLRDGEDVVEIVDPDHANAFEGRLVDGVLHRRARYEAAAMADPAKRPALSTRTTIGFSNEKARAADLTRRVCRMDRTQRMIARVAGSLPIWPISVPESTSSMSPIDMTIGKPMPSRSRHRHLGH